MALAVLAAIAGAMIVGLIGISVAMRYLAYAPFRFTEELVGLLMTGAFFLALPLVTLRGDHVRVLILVSNLPGHVTRRVGVLARYTRWVVICSQDILGGDLAINRTQNVTYWVFSSSSVHGMQRDICSVCSVRSVV